MKTKDTMDSATITTPLTTQYQVGVHGRPPVGVYEAAKRHIQDFAGDLEQTRGALGRLSFHRAERGPRRRQTAWARPGPTSAPWRFAVQGPCPRGARVCAQARVRSLEVGRNVPVLRPGRNWKTKRSRRSSSAPPIVTRVSRC